MRIIAVFIGLIAACASIAMAGFFPDEFSKGETLRVNKKHREAHEHFVKLAKEAPTSRSRSECLVRAATSLAKTGQVAEAMELAKTVEIKPMSINCQMEIMLGSGKTRDLIKAFGGEDIAAWPVFVADSGFYHRGLARAQKGNHAKAAQDLSEAVERSKGDDWLTISALSALAEAHAALGEKDKVLEDLLRIQSFENYRDKHAFTKSVIKRAEIFRERKAYDEALKELDKIDPGKASVNRQALTLMKRGDVLNSMGKSDEAMAKYREALRRKNVANFIVRRVEAKINAMSEAAQENGQ